jgi:hypothetical protein
MSRSDRALRLCGLAPALAFAALLGGCADIYYDRRESITFHAGDAAATNKVTHMIDPWPRAAANRNIEANGERVQRAVERYRTNKTTPLAGTATSSAGYGAAPAGAAGQP